MNTSPSLRGRYSLLQDKAPNAEIERRIRDGVELQGATPWILMFAILVASVGLNVNSTAVIIGAMLISPLMGPIMGIGHGIATLDVFLLRRSLRNLALFAGISLLMSTLYFVLTPLKGAQSELLARTSPTLWDVLIALFGGLAGIIGLTREEKSNVVPGVAIATALMPPLCTAGYGVANGQWRFFGGALYLFAINCVFIALAAFIGLRLVQMPRHRVQDAAERRLTVVVWLVAVVTIVPSVFLAAGLVQDEVYRSRATAFVKREFALPDVYVLDTRVDATEHRIDVSLIGAPVPRATRDAIRQRLSKAGLAGSTLEVHQSQESEAINVAELKATLMNDLYRDRQTESAERGAQLEALRAELAGRDALSRQAPAVLAELRAQEPSVSQLVLATGVESRAGEGGDTGVTQQEWALAQVGCSKELDAATRERVTRWLGVRTGKKVLQVEFRLTSEAFKTPEPSAKSAEAPTGKAAALPGAAPSGGGR